MTGERGKCEGKLTRREVVGVAVVVERAVAVSTAAKVFIEVAATAAAARISSEIAIPAAIVVAPWSVIVATTTTAVAVVVVCGPWSVGIRAI